MAIDLEALRKKHQELSKTNDGNKSSKNDFLMLKDGTNLIRILPAKEEDSLFYAETKIHRVKLPGKDYENNIHCRRLLGEGEQCPVCNLYYALWKTKDKSDESLARSIKPRERYFLNVVDREDDKVKIFSLGSILFKKIIATMLDPDFGDITDLESGHDFKLVKVMETGSDGKAYPKYDQSQARPKSEPAGTKKKIDEYMGSLHNLKELVDIKSYDELKEIANSITPDHLLSQMENMAGPNSGGSKNSSDTFKNLRA